MRKRAFRRPSLFDVRSQWRDGYPRVWIEQGVDYPHLLRHEGQTEAGIDAWCDWVAQEVESFRIRAKHALRAVHGQAQARLKRELLYVEIARREYLEEKALHEMYCGCDASVVGGTCKGKRK